MKRILSLFAEIAMIQHNTAAAGKKSHRPISAKGNKKGQSGNGDFLVNEKNVFVQGGPIHGQHFNWATNLETFSNQDFLTIFGTIFGANGRQFKTLVLDHLNENFVFRS